jgi:hypothetical protein
MNKNPIIWYFNGKTRYLPGHVSKEGLEEFDAIVAAINAYARSLSAEPEKFSNFTLCLAMEVASDMDSYAENKGVSQNTLKLFGLDTPHKEPHFFLNQEFIEREISTGAYNLERFISVVNLFLKKLKPPQEDTPGVAGAPSFIDISTSGC